MQIKVLKKLSHKKYEAKRNYAVSFVQYLSEEFKIKGKILDIGAGRGEYKKPFESVKLIYKGIDAEPEKDFINKCDMSKEPIPFKDNTFDIVFMRYVIEQIDKWDDITKTIDEIKRVLKPGGMFIVITSDWIKKHKTFYDTFDHVSPYTKMSLHRLLEYHRFETIVSRDYINIPFIWRYLPVFSFKHKLINNGLLYIGKNVKKNNVI